MTETNDLALPSGIIIDEGSGALIARIKECLHQRQLRAPRWRIVSGRPQSRAAEQRRVQRAAVHQHHPAIFLKYFRLGA